MEKSHVISDSLFNEAQAEFAVGRNWIAYNTKTYYLDNADMWFFRDKEEAIDFANDNISDVDSYAVIYANSIISLMRQLPYGQDIHFSLTKKELDELFQSIDWKDAFYDPLHDNIEATTEQEKDDLARMETLLVEWENLYNRDTDAALQLAATYWEGHPMETYKEDFLTIKYDLMNERNFDYLKSNIRNHGFGETLGPELEAALREQNMNCRKLEREVDQLTRERDAAVKLLQAGIRLAHIHLGGLAEKAFQRFFDEIECNIQDVAYEIDKRITERPFSLSDKDEGQGRGNADLRDGIAHEINNPAAAVVRALQDVIPDLIELQRMNLVAGRNQIDEAHTQEWLKVRDDGYDAILHNRVDALSLSDRSEELLDWLAVELMGNRESGIGNEGKR